MARYKTTVSTATDPDTAFAALARFSTTEDWDPGVRAARMLTPEPVGLGSEFELMVVFAGRTLPTVYRVVEYDAAARHVVLFADEKHFTSRDAIDVSVATAGKDVATPGADKAAAADRAAAGGATTLVTYDAELHLKGAGAIADPALKLAFGRVGRRAEAGLRAYVDGLSTADSG